MPPDMSLSEDLLARLRRIRLFLCDVDGVMTDGSILVGPGVEMKRFDIRDGFSLRLLQQEGMRVGWISARPSEATAERARDLKVDFVRQSPAPKVTVIGELLAELGVPWTDLCYMGDDIIDLGALQRAGFSAAPADAVPEVRERVHYVSSHPGGRGAVREVVELILKTNGRWDAAVAKFAS
jgi:3-deoxy-D-manno-octulosonate 8-phosphate phosphatase (KDO 8-P phosphatase)